MTHPHEALSVLLVEDNQTDILVIEEALRKCRLAFNVRIARDGEDALSYLEHAEPEGPNPCPDLLLLDLNIPKIPGIEVLRRMRRVESCQTTPVVVVTSSDSETDRAAARGLGIAAYFRKSADLAEYMDLARVIMKVLAS